MGRLDGQVAIVTGAGSGNGQAIAAAYAREGAMVVLGEYSEERGRAAEASIKDSVVFIKADVRSWEDIDSLVTETVRRFGRLDILVNNAGVLDGYANCQDTSVELFDQVLAINLRGVFFGCKRALAEMVPAGAGRIVNIASVAGLRAGGGGFTYTISKHALVGLTRQLAFDYGAKGVRVNAICPGTIATNLRQTSMQILGDTAPEMSNAGVGAASPDRIRERVPLGMRGSPEDIAGAAVFLASAEASYVNGHMLVVDGGWTVH